MRAVLARAREKTRKNKKKTSKKARCRNPACGQLSALLACQGTGHPCGVPPPLRGGSPSRISWPPAGAAMCPPTAYGLRGFALRLPPPPPFRGGRVALCRQGCRAYGPAALLSFTPAGSVGRSRSVKGRCAFRGWPVSSLRCGPRQPPPPPLTALPLQQPDSQTAANRSKRPVAAFFGLGGTSGRGGARKRAVGPFPGFLAVSADSTLNGHLFQYFVDSSPLHLDTWLLRLPAISGPWRTANTSAFLLTKRRNRHAHLTLPYVSCKGIP